MEFFSKSCDEARRRPLIAQRCSRFQRVEIARGSRHTIVMNAKPAAALEPDHEEILEWIEAFDEDKARKAPGGVPRLLDPLTRRARQSGVDVPVQLNTPYVNTISVDEEVPYPGDRVMERRIKSLIR